MHQAPMGLSSLWPSCILEVRLGSLPLFLLCVCVFQEEMGKERCHLATGAANLDFVEETTFVGSLYLKLLH